ncbi:MAG: hypothetical protein D3924_05125 [Candidatus Electrothrix sp. AR4]|nr:hypothetical protein [Candidatus Electrothrix sp. AR4]
MSVNFALLLSLAAFTAGANTAGAVDIPISAADAQVSGAMSSVLSDPAVKNVMNAKRDEVMAEKVSAKPLMNKLMPNMETVMMPVVKEMVLPEQMKGLQSNLASKIAPNF